MGDLTANFSRSEFACKCGCGFDTVDIKTVHYCQALRDWIGRAVTVTSGCRCLAYNRSLVDAQGRPLSSDNSQHIVARAADLVVPGVPAPMVYEFFDGLNVPGLGRYSDFTHIDTRSSGRARW